MSTEGLLFTSCDVEISIHILSQYEQYGAALVISDTHVGLSPENEVFEADLEAFISYLSNNQVIKIQSEEGDFAFQRPKATVLLGDFLDLWDGRPEVLPSFISDFGRAFTEIADVFYLRGNHDYIIPDIPSALKLGTNGNRLQIRENLLLELGGKPCFFIHGHQFMSAFGSTSLKIESYVNPYYSIIESFFSRFTRGHGRAIMLALTFAFLGGIGLIGLAGFSIIKLSIPIWLVFLLGLLLPVGVASTWRSVQKPLWRFIMRIFDDQFKFLRGALRGDTIQYLTSDSKPIARWFAGDDKGQSEAKQAGFVCFGHTHIPEGPSQGTDGSLKNITFLNTGSWVRPPRRGLQSLAGKARDITRRYDKIDHWLLLVLIAAGIVLFELPQVLSGLFPLAAIVALLSGEIVVVFGKSSYRRLPSAGVRSLAFIGVDLAGTWRSELLYWDPKRKVLSTSPAGI